MNNPEQKNSICPVCYGAGRDVVFNNICTYCNGEGRYNIIEINKPMEKTIGINLEIPEQFSYELDQYLLDLKTTGVRKSKAQYIIELAQRAFLHDKCCDEIIKNQ